MLKRLLIVFVLLISSSAHADQLNREQLRKIVQGLNPVVVKNNGQDGIWFTKIDSERILEVLEKRLPLALDIIDAQDRQIESLKSSVDSYKSSLVLYQEYSTYNLKMFEVAMKSVPDLKPPELMWYEKPATTFTYGVVTGIAIVVTSAYILDRSFNK
jgi:uncharacterized membrane protein